MTSNDDGNDVVQICIVQGDAFVWSPRWIAKLRREHGIVGMLIGSLPLIPQQNVFLGVPLQLFEEEVVYLVRKRAAVLVDDVAAHALIKETMNKQELDAWHQERAKEIEQNKRSTVEHVRQSRLQWEQHAAAKENVSEKRKERERKRKERRQQEEQADGPVDADADAAGLSSEADNEWYNAPHLVTIATSSLELPWRSLRVGQTCFDTLSSAVRAGIWRYPLTATDRARCATFEDLRRRKNFYMGKGLRFGGDFVVYPGDPLRYHSHFTATVQASQSTYVSAQELVAAGRLGTAVKKAHLLCAVNAEDVDAERTDVEGSHGQVNENSLAKSIAAGQFDSLQQCWGSVDYYSLTWAGFGT